MITPEIAPEIDRDLLDPDLRLRNGRFLAYATDSESVNLVEAGVAGDRVRDRIREL